MSTPAVNSSNILSQLGAGSGINTRELAENLVNASRIPREQMINNRIEQTESRITGLAVVKLALSELQNAFSGLNKIGDFANSIATQNSQPTAFGVSTSSGATPGSHSVEVNQLAQAQRSVLGLPGQNGEVVPATKARDASLNGGNAFTLTINVDGIDKTVTIDENKDTLEGIAAAINKKNREENLGVSAQLTRIGTDEFAISFSGEVGASKAFSVAVIDPAIWKSLTGSTVDPGDLDPAVSDPPYRLDTVLAGQEAQDAEVRVNGLTVTRSSNTITEVIPGVTLNLFAETSTPASLQLQRDLGDITQRFQNLVSAYNDFDELLTVLGDRSSEVEDFGGALAGDGFLTTLRSQMRSLIAYDQGDRIKAGQEPASGDPDLRLQFGFQVGLGFSDTGKLQLNEEALSEALNDRFDDVIQMMTDGRESGPSAFSQGSLGLAGDASRALAQLLRNTPDGAIFRQEVSARQEITRQQDALERLERRMEMLLDRYIRQFSAMEALVTQTNAMQDNLRSTFEGMMAAYTRR